MILEESAHQPVPEGARPEWQGFAVSVDCGRNVGSLTIRRMEKLHLGRQGDEHRRLVPGRFVVSIGGATLVQGDAPTEAFRLDDVKGVAVEVRLAEGRKCARSWKILPSVGSDPAYPDVSPRDAKALREWEAMRKAAE